MASRIIDNGLVKMEWDADMFLETSEAGFWAAIQVYNTEKGEVPVVFQDSQAFMMYDADEDRLCTVSELIDYARECVADGDDYVSAYGDAIIMLGSMCVDAPENAYAYGMTDDDIADVDARLSDLYQAYWEEVEFPMGDDE